MSKEPIQSPKPCDRGLTQQTDRLLKRGVGKGLLGCLVFAASMATGCGAQDDFWDAEEWDVSAAVMEDHVLLSATIADAHGDFVHMSIRREGHDSGYTIERSPAPNQPHRDWSRVHHWFGELHPNTYLEGRIDDGSGRGPSSFNTYAFELPRESRSSRENFPDVHGSDYEFITQGYSYADGGYSGHPAFDAGTYEVEIYAWYTGTANEEHPAVDDSEGVQYVHYEHHLASTTFVVE